MRVPKSVKSWKKKKHKPLYVAYMYLSPWKFFRNQILLDYLGRWRNQSCQIFFQSVHSGVSGKGSKFAISSANRRWPLQLLYYRTTVIILYSQVASKHANIMLHHGGVDQTRDQPQIKHYMLFICFIMFIFTYVTYCSFDIFSALSTIPILHFFSVLCSCLILD